MVNFMLGTTFKNTEEKDHSPQFSKPKAFDHILLKAVPPNAVATTSLN